MSNLDMSYIADLIRQAQDGDSNAFAEFFAATYQKQFEFSLHCLNDRFLAVDALKSTYTNALRNLSRVRDALLSIPWLTQYNIRSCMELQEKRRVMESKEKGETDTPSFRPEDRTISVDGQEIGLHRIMSLPFTESQSIILRYHFGMNVRDIASVLELKPKEVKRYIQSGCKRLNGVDLDKEGNGKNEEAIS